MRCLAHCVAVGCMALAAGAVVARFATEFALLVSGASALIGGWALFFTFLKRPEGGYELPSFKASVFLLVLAWTSMLGALAVMGRITDPNNAPSAPSSVSAFPHLNGLFAAL